MILGQERPLQAAGKSGSTTSPQGALCLTMVDHVRRAPSAGPCAGPDSPRFVRRLPGCGSADERCSPTRPVRIRARCSFLCCLPRDRPARPWRAPTVSTHYPSDSRKRSAASSSRQACNWSPANMHGACSQAPRHSPNSSVSLPSGVVSPGRMPNRCAHVLQDALSAAQGTADRTTDPSPRLAVWLILLEKPVEGQRVLNLGRRQLQQLGDLDDRLQGHMTKVFVHHVQGRQRHRLATGIARKIRPGFPRPFRRSTYVVGSSLTIQFGSNDIQTPQDGDHIAQCVARNQWGKMPK